MKVSKWMSAVVAAAALQAGGPAIAQAAAAGAPAQPGAAAALPVDGEVRKVDKAQGKLTLKHGPIASLDMDAMTMVFTVSDARLLDAVKPGDKVRFAVAKVNGVLTVTGIEVRP